MEQARAVVEALQSSLVPETQLLSSPLARARETAAPLAATLAAPVKVIDAVTEILAPVPLAERQAWLRQFMRQRWGEQPDSLHQWRERAIGELLALNSPAVVFTHFLVINAVVGQIVGDEKTLHFWPANGSITHLRSRDGQLELVALGAQMDTVVN
jgi:probable phosphoglycerate mutase